MDVAPFQQISLDNKKKKRQRQKTKKKNGRAKKHKKVSQRQTVSQRQKIKRQSKKINKYYNFIAHLTLAEIRLLSELEELKKRNRI